MPWRKEFLPLPGIEPRLLGHLDVNIIRSVISPKYFLQMG